MALTKKQMEFYQFIVSYIKTNHASPTQAEIKKNFNFRSLGSVQDYLVILKRYGLIKNDKGSVRGIVPLIRNGKCPVCNHPGFSER